MILAKKLLLSKKKILPREYQQVEYIRGEGLPWINTGIFPTEDMKFEFKYSPTSITPSLYPTPFGVGITQSLNNAILFRQDTMKAKWGNGDYFGYGGSAVLDEIYEGSFEFNKLVLNGSEYIGICTPITGTFTYSMSLFGFRKGTDGYINSYTNWAGKFYYFRAYENNVLIRNMIPCYRKSDNAIGMYDTVEGVFHTNSGTGRFTKGDDV